MGKNVATLIILFFTSCNFPDNNGGAPTFPQYIRPHVTYDSLPGYYNPATLMFTIRFVGEENNMPVRVSTGDTLRWLLMFFRADEWVEGLNAITDPDWYWYDSVHVGEEISLQTQYQITRANYDGYSQIKLMYRMDAYVIDLDSIKQILIPDTIDNHIGYHENEWEFGFNHVTGDTATGF